MRWHWFIVVMSCLSYFIIHTDPAPFTAEEIRQSDWIAQRHNYLEPLTWSEINECIKSHHKWPLYIYEIHVEFEKRLNDFKEWKIKNKQLVEKKAVKAPEVYAEFLIVYDPIVVKE